MGFKVILKITQTNDRFWFWVQKSLKRYIRLDSAPSRWGFTAFLVAFSLSSVTIAPSIRALGGEDMIAFSWICFGVGIVILIISLSFVSFISRNAPKPEGIEKAIMDIGIKIDKLIDEIRHDRDERNKSK